MRVDVSRRKERVACVAGVSSGRERVSCVASVSSEREKVACGGKREKREGKGSVQSTCDHLFSRKSETTNLGLSENPQKRVR